MAFSINLRNVSRTNHFAIRAIHSTVIRCTSAASKFLTYDKDPAKSFFDRENQKLMKSMTRLELEKVYRKRTVTKNTVEYKFMTADQVEEEVRRKFKHAKYLLHMPPVIQVRKDSGKIICNDPGLSGFSESSMVFTDITFGLKNDDRSVVIRNTDGTLEEASLDIRKRVCQIYFPLSGRKLRDPKMFQPEYLKRLIDNQEYEFLLDSLCIQCEPHEPQYHEITANIYNHINDNETFDKLRSTRHFGPMAFFFAWHKLIDNLLIDMIRRDYLKNAVELICLMFKLNGIQANTSVLHVVKEQNDHEREIQSRIDKLLNKSEIETDKIEKTEKDFKLDELCFLFIQDEYVQKHSPMKGLLELTLQSYKERDNELKNIAQGIGNV